MLVLCSFLTLWFQANGFTGLLELIKLYKQNPLEDISIFTIYQSYTLALRPVFKYKIKTKVLKLTPLGDVLFNYTLPTSSKHHGTTVMSDMYLIHTLISKCHCFSNVT